MSDHLSFLESKAYANKVVLDDQTLKLAILLLYLDRTDRAYIGDLMLQIDQTPRRLTQDQALEIMGAGVAGLRLVRKLQGLPLHAQSLPIAPPEEQAQQPQPRHTTRRQAMPRNRPAAVRREKAAAGN